MSWGIPLIIGFIIGWLVELFIDYFFWRPRRICTDHEVQLQTSLGRVEEENTELRSQAAAWQEQGTRLTGLEADLRTKQGELAGLTAQLETKDGELAALTATMAKREAEIAGLQGLSTQTADLQARLAAKDAEIEQLSAKGRLLAEREAELAGLRGLQSRVTELEDQLKIKDAELANLQPAGIGDTLPTGSVGGAALGGALAGAAVAGVAGFVAGSNAEAGPEDGSVRDDLTKVWGIGPKINKLLNNSGIFTFGKLARTQVNTLDQFLDEAGPNYQLADTSITQTWPEQAAIAASGDWQALRTYQQRFRRGSRPDNLARIWGIGLKRSQMLHRRGINTFATLAKVQPADIVDVLENGSEQYGMDKEELYRLWTDQAALLAQGKSKAFSDMRREYQQRYTTHDRLQRLWGIGPKTANALKAEGIDTYAELAEADLDDLGEIADTARLRPGLDKRQLYEIWIKQAKLATDNKWAELEKVAAELEAKFGHNREDDLTQIWGIGPKIDKILRQNGIKNFAQLAATDAGKLGKILKQAGSRFSLSTLELQQSWTEQARLANEGRWEELEALQAKLSWSDGTSS